MMVIRPAGSEAEADGLAARAGSAAGRGEAGASGGSLAEVRLP